MVKTIIWYSIEGDGAGAAYLKWFLSKAAADRHQESLEEGWGEPCVGSVETYLGSSQHMYAIANEEEEGL